MGILNHTPETIIVSLYDVVEYIGGRIRPHVDIRNHAKIAALLNFDSFLNDFVAAAFQSSGLGQVSKALERVGVPHLVALEITSEAFSLTVERIGHMDRELTMGFEDEINFRVDEIYDLYITRVKVG